MNTRSRLRRSGTIHPGADDNASGTAGVIELARWFSKQPQQKRGILFMTFAGEELGLLGSNWYANHPLLPLENAVAMINMDMIGRIRDGKVYVSGTGTGSTLRQTGGVRQAAARGFKHRSFRKPPATARSDHTSFTVEAGAGAVLLLAACTAIITSPATPPTRSTRPTPPSCSITSRRSPRVWLNDPERPEV